MPPSQGLQTLQIQGGVMSLYFLFLNSQLTTNMFKTQLGRCCLHLLLFTLPYISSYIAYPHTCTFNHIRISCQCNFNSSWQFYPKNKIWWLLINVVLPWHSVQYIWAFLIQKPDSVLLDKLQPYTFIVCSLTLAPMQMMQIYHWEMWLPLHHCGDFCLLAVNLCVKIHRT